MFCARGGMEVLRALPPTSHGNLATPCLFYGVFEKQASLPKEFFQGKEMSELTGQSLKLLQIATSP